MDDRGGQGAGVLGRANYVLLATLPIAVMVIGTALASLPAAVLRLLCRFF
jgi:hypothetical protein